TIKKNYSFNIIFCLYLYIYFFCCSLKNVCFSSALFTEVPQDMISQAGDDVEMACSFRGASSSSVSLEIQWWYTRDWAEQPSWTTNQESLYLFGATKISVVKVVGSNISHKLRLSSVRPSDEGTYECRVTDFSESRAQQHRVQAYLQVLLRLHLFGFFWSCGHHKERRRIE
uniref:V-set and transmembrane domain containing 2 like n=1 Tax=Sinocyclocheilus grahami TaxID=75366 RepID=A0A672N2F9_SINGR